MRGALKPQTYVSGKQYGVRGGGWSPWYRGGLSAGRAPRRYPFATATKRFNLNDSINSPGFPGSSTYYFDGLGEQVATQAPKSIWENIAENLTKITTTAVPAYMQYKVWNENLKRSRQGLAPLDPNTYAPSARVQIDAGPEVQSMARTAGFGIGGMALLGVGLYLLLRRK